MDRTPVNLAVEDALSEAMLRKMIEQCAEALDVCACYQRHGQGYLKKNIGGFNSAARITPFIVLTDLDAIECAPFLITEWLPYGSHRNLLLRVAVREVESWLLANRDGFARYLSISEALIPLKVEDIMDPKQFLIGLARKSKKRSIREAIVPKMGSGAVQGPDYNGALIDFVRHFWDIDEAANNAASISRAIERIAAFRPALEWTE
jgi:hypothetical protein